MNKKIKRCVIYLRVSDYQKQVINKDGQSLDLQLIECERYMEARGYEIVKVFREEGISGKTQFRDQFQEMLQFINKHKNDPTEKITACTFFAITRLGRSARLILNTVESLKSIGCQIFSVSDGANDADGTSKLLLTILSGMAEYEAYQLAERTFPMQLHKVKTQGSYQGSRYVSYGYTYNKGDKKLTVVDEEARQVKMIYDFFCNGIDNDYNVGQYKIAKYMNRIGEKWLRDGSEWTSKRIADILRNEHYIGTYVFNRKGTKYKTIDTEDFTETKYEMSKKSKNFRPVRETFEKEESEIVRYENAHEAIISHTVWVIAKNKIEKNKRQHPLDTSRTTKHLLTKLLYCPDCKGKMTATKMYKKDRTYETYYKCQYASGGGNCNFNLIKEAYILPRILDVFFTYYEFYIRRVLPDLLMDSLMVNENIIDNDSDKIASIELRKERLYEEQRKLRKEYNNELIDEDFYKMEMKTITQQISILNKEIGNINHSSQDKIVNKNEIEQFVDKFSAFKDVRLYFDNLDRQGQIELLSKLIYRVVFEKYEGRKGENSFAITSIKLNKEMIHSYQSFSEKLNKIGKTNQQLYKKFSKIRYEVEERLGLESHGLQPLMRKIIEIEERENTVLVDLNTGEEFGNLTSMNNQFKEGMKKHKAMLLQMDKSELREYLRSNKLDFNVDAYYEELRK
ncbi:recombinase family protein [Paenibacillus sp. FSL H7-0735]|uniref:recombinase family protein n=1 Tax=Paenibacillus sp. FSL H7-0735 TaxID=2954736 RepID=UPI0030F9321C